MKSFGKFSVWFLETINNETSSIVKDLQNRLHLQGMDESEFMNKRLNELEPESITVPGATTKSSIKDMIKDLQSYKSLSDAQKMQIDGLELNTKIRDLIDIFITKVK